MLDTQTGEERDYKPSSTKDQCLESARVSLLYASELIKYNFLKNDTVMSVELTFRGEPVSYVEFQAGLRNFTRRIRGVDKDAKYVFVKEAGSDGRFHVHSIIWSPKLTEEIIRDKWKYGNQVCFQEITEKRTSYTRRHT